MPAPRVNKAQRETTVDFDGQKFLVKWVPLTIQEDVLAKESAMVFDMDGSFRLKAWTYIQEKLKRMVQEIDGEKLLPESPAWKEMPDGFDQVLWMAIMPGDRSSFRGEVPASP